MGLKRWALAMALGVGALLLSSAGGETFHHPQLNSRYYRLKLWHMSVSVPHGWTLTAATRTNATTTWTVTGTAGTLQLSSTPLQPLGNAEQILPMQPGTGAAIPTGSSPYQTTSLTYHGHQFAEQVLSRNGTLYTLTLDMAPLPIRSPIAQHIIGSWKHAPRISVSEAVHRLQHLQYWYYDQFPDYSQSFANPRDGWILVGAQPAGPQESFYLFQTASGGRTWRLERYTIWQGCLTGSHPMQCNFLHSAGSVSMLFWNARDGAIVQMEFPTQRLAAWMTDNGGRTWQVSHIPVYGSRPLAGVRMARRDGRLTLTMLFMGSHARLREAEEHGRWVVMS